MHFKNTSPEDMQEPGLLSIEAVKGKMEALIGHKNFREGKVLTDEKGVYRYEAIVTSPGGDDSLYSYRRKGTYSDSEVRQTAIDVVHCRGPIENEQYAGGTTLSQYDDSTQQWLDMGV